MTRAALDGEAARYRRRRLLALVLLVVLVGFGLVVGARSLLLHATRFRVATIEVVGTSAGPAGLDPAKVRAAAGVTAGTPLLAVDLENVKRRVAKVSEVASVDAGRRWPNTLRVTVTERTPVALASSSTGPRLVDGTGLAYQAAPAQRPGLPRLAADRVAPGDPATLAGLAVLTSLNPALREKLQVVEVAGPSAVTLRMADGRQVRWGSSDDSIRKMAVLNVLLSQPGSIYDVSAPDLPTIRR
ncbi:hypothetical protein GCM10023321_61530 [Pseudonocardia eucalypti]|uniref:POTRA domain-containing protein n=1 Tax=Pseudonocardia eucalypti TaxID=648755 RepID=A0ABP9QVR4_9PSEU|nr:cell division protein FtsQ [Pseudonocardia eucalypti]